MPAPSYRWYSWIAAIAILAVCSAVTTHRPKSKLEPLINEAVRNDQRLTDGWLTSLPYAHGRLADKAVSSQLHLLGYDLLLKGELTPSERAAAQIACSNLTGAIATLEEATRHASADASLWSDLACVRLERGARTGDAREIVAALFACDRALLIDNRFAPALFNRALAIDRLGLKPLFVIAARKYLDVDKASGWAEETRRALRAADKPAPSWKSSQERLERAALNDDAASVTRIVHAFPREARTLSEGEYLARWGEATLRGDARTAASALKLARMTAAALLDRNGESLPHDAVAAIDAANGQRRRHLARGHVIYRQGRTLFSQWNVAAARKQLEAAEQELAAGHSPMRFVSRFYAANAALHTGNARSILTALDGLLSALPADYLSLRGDILKQRTYINGRRGRMLDALEDSIAATRIFDRLGETVGAEYMRALTAGAYAALGRQPDAWRIRSQLFTDAGAHAPEILELILNSAAADEMRAGHADLAFALFNLQLDFPSKSSRLRFYARLQRRYAAQSAGIVLVEDDSASRTEAMRLPKAPQPEVLDAAPVALIAAAHAALALQDDTTAINELERAVTLLESATSAVGRDDLRDTFFGSMADAYSLLAVLRARHGDLHGAFAAIERSRARAIAERLDAPVEQPPGVDDIVRALPTGTLLISYTIVDAETLILLLDERGLRGASVPIGKNAISQAVIETDSAIDRGTESAAQLWCARLSALLLAPLATDLYPARTIVIVPDPLIADVPFAALLHPKKGTHLVEEASIVIAPSATAWLRETKARRQAPDNAFLAADPTLPRFDINLSPLPNTRVEAAQIAAFYPHSDVVVGNDASRANVVNGIRRSDVVHLAMHTLVNLSDPWMSALPLSANDTDHSLLYLREIASMKLRNAPIVVLAGCRTGRAVTGPGSIRSLADAFLAAGTRSVVASLWTVDDDSARYFSVLLHRRLSQGESAPEAVRASQLEMLRSTNSLYRRIRTWSTFQAYGGS